MRAYPLLDYTKGIRLVRLPVWQRSPRTFASTLAVQAAWAFPLLLRGTQIMHLRGLTPETLALARIARRIGAKTICVPMASGAYGDVALFPPHAPHKFEAFDWISALTEPLRDEIVTWGFPADRVGIIPNGVDTHEFHPPHNPAPAVTFVGQFRPEKQIDLLLQAWRLIQRDCPHARLTLVGGGRLLTEYQERARALHLTPTFVPNTDQASVLAQLQANSIFVLPGISEGMSNALLEAMAVGLAPVVSDTPANRAVITPESSGLVYAPDSADALAAQIARLINDPILRQKLGEAARRTVVQRFDLNSVVDRYAMLYQRLLGEIG